MDDIAWIRESLKRIEDKFDEFEIACRDRHVCIDRELATLKIKATLYGALAGAAPAIVAVIVFAIKYL